MPVKSIDHVLLAMPAGREAEARAFYQGMLGIPEVKKPAVLTKRGGCWFEQGALKIHLGVEADFRALADDQFRMRNVERRCKLCTDRALHTMLGPQNLRAVVELDRGEMRTAMAR